MLIIGADCPSVYGMNVRAGGFDGRRQEVPLIRNPVEWISGIWKFRREPAGYRRSRSLPGHLLHLVLEGSYRLKTNGREYAVKPGDVVYYYETEEVEWLGNDEPVIFYSVGFMAPGIKPLQPDRRVFRSTASIRNAFDDLYASSVMDRTSGSALAAHSALLRIILEIDWWKQAEVSDVQSGAALWWRIERAVREKKQFKASLVWMSRVAGCSRATVVRACRAATGQSPIHRLRAIRMEEADGLLRYSTLNVTQVADYLGYTRVHEFSREFSGYFKRTPSGMV